MSDLPASASRFNQVADRAYSLALEAASGVIAAGLPAEVGAAAMLRVAFDMTHSAAALYSPERGPNGFPTLGSPVTMRVFRAIAEAWACSPNQEAMQEELARRLGEVLNMTPVIMR